MPPPRGGMMGGRGGYGRGRNPRSFGQQQFGRQHFSGLSENLLVMFRPRPPMEYERPPKRPRQKLPYTGVAQYLEHFEDRKEGEDAGPSASATPLALPRRERKALAVKTKREAASKVLAEKLAEYKEAKAALSAAGAADKGKDAATDGGEDGGAATAEPGDLTKDPYHTLFVSRLDFGVTEADLTKVFEKYGRILSVKLVRDTNTTAGEAAAAKSKGYAFIEYSSSREMKDAYRDADGVKILNRKCCVDVERGRTLKDWKPMRVGGGRGGESRRPKMSKKARKANLGGRSFDRGGDRGPPPRGWHGGGGGGHGRFDRGRDRERGPPRRHDMADRPRYEPRHGRDRGGLGFGDRDRDRRDRDRGDRHDRRGGDRDRDRGRQGGDWRDRDRDRKRDRDRDRGGRPGGESDYDPRDRKRRDEGRGRDRSPDARAAKRPKQQEREEGEL